MDKFVERYSNYINSLEDSVFKAFRLIELKEEQMLYDVRGRYSHKFIIDVLTWQLDQLEK